MEATSGQVATRWDARSLVAHFFGFFAAGAILVPALTFAVMFVLPTTLATTAQPVSLDAWFLLQSVLFAPVLEELMFRWSFRQALDGSKFERHWMWSGALAFATFEFLAIRTPLKFVSALLVGFALAWVYKRSGSILTAMVAHSGLNTGVLFTAFTLLWLAA